MTPPEVTILSATATLIAPSPIAALALARDSDDAAVNVALAAAALRMCWPEDVAWPAKKRPRLWVIGTPLARYGHPIFDALCQVDGVRATGVVSAGIEAYNWAVINGLSEGEVKAAEDFSEAPAQEV